jgi:hypothetical protein
MRHGRPGKISSDMSGAAAFLRRLARPASRYGLLCALPIVQRGMGVGGRP